jgi:hypothetical protein
LVTRYITGANITIPVIRNKMVLIFNLNILFSININYFCFQAIVFINKPIMTAAATLQAIYNILLYFIMKEQKK